MTLQNIFICRPLHGHENLCFSQGYIQIVSVADYMRVRTFAGKHQLYTTGYVSVNQNAP